MEADGVHADDGIGTGRARDFRRQSYGGRALAQMITSCAIPRDRGDLALFVERQDRAAMGRLFQRYGDAAFGLACRTLMQVADAENALQTAYLKIIQNADAYRGEGTVRAWIMGFVVNACRRTKREQQGFRRTVEAERLLVQHMPTDALAPALQYSGLGWNGDAEVTEWLSARALKLAHEADTRELLLALGRSGGHAAVQSLLAISRRRDAFVRAYAFEALGFTRHDDALEPLTEAFKRAKPGMERAAIAEALGCLRVETAERVLLESITNRNRGAAIRGLSRCIGYPGTYQCLARRLTRPEDPIWKSYQWFSSSMHGKCRILHPAFVADFVREACRPKGVNSPAKLLPVA